MFIIAETIIKINFEGCMEIKSDILLRELIKVIGDSLKTLSVSA